VLTPQDARINSEHNAKMHFDTPIDLGGVSVLYTAVTSATMSSLLTCRPGTVTTCKVVSKGSQPRSKISQLATQCSIVSLDVRAVRYAGSLLVDALEAI
jgi:hypothetical protein